MEQQIQFIGFSYLEAEKFLKSIVSACIKEQQDRKNEHEAEVPLSPSQASQALKVSLPTLRRYVGLGLIRRHDLGPRRKVFYLSELEADIKNVQTTLWAHKS